jgi:hypothetical protein
MASPTPPDLHAQLRATRLELAAVRRALQERRVVRSRPASSYDTARALAAVLQHSTSAAMEELRAERDRLARDLSSSKTRRRTLQNKCSSMRYHVWQLARRALDRFESAELALDHMCDETADSEDDRAWEDGGWVHCGEGGAAPHPLRRIVSAAPHSVRCAAQCPLHRAALRLKPRL